MPPSTVVVITDDMRKRVVAFIKKNKTISNRQCRELLGLGYDQVINLFNHMVSSGELLREGKTSSVRYRLPEKQ
jgi:predicted HTH transcriptional regulator